MGLNTNPYSNTPIKNLEYIQNKALVIAPFEITKFGLLDTDLMLDTPGTITMYFFRKTFNDIDKEPTSEQFKTVGTVSDINTKLGLDISASNISTSITSSYYLGFTKISVIFKYDKNTGVRTIEKDTSLLGEDYIDIGIDNTCDLTTEDYFVICNVTKNTKATNSEFTDTTGMDFLFMIPSGECQEIITDFDILDANNKTINVKKYGTLSSGFAIDNDITIEPAYEADFFGDGSNIATYLFDGTARDLTGNYNGTTTGVTYGEGKVGQAAVFDGTGTFRSKINLSGYTSYTMSAWVKKPTTTSTFSMGQGVNASGPRCELLWYHDGYLYAECGSRPNIYNKYLPPVNDTNWHHILYTFNNGITNMYFDGVLLSLVSSSGTLSTTVPIFTNEDFIIGLRYNISIVSYVDQVRIFNRALNQNEVTALYLNNGSTRVIKQESNVVNNKWTQIQLETVESIQAPSIVEQTGKILTNTGVTIDTIDSDSKFPNGSLSFKGSNYLTFDATNILNFGTNDFTIEFWYYTNSSTNYNIIMGIDNNNDTYPFALEVSTSRGFAFLDYSTILNYRMNPNISQWKHYAITRTNGSILTLFIDGINVATRNISANIIYNFTNMYIGKQGNYYANGFLNDFRISNISRYNTTNFTPPTSGLVKDANTVFLLQATNSNQPLTIKDPKRKDFFGDKSMVACYMLDSNANDETGFHHGIVGSSVTFETGKFGKQAIFDGSTKALITLPDGLLSLVTGNTLSLWMSFTELSTNIKTRIITLVGGFKFTLALDYPTKKFILRSNGVNYYTSQILEVNKLYHIVITFGLNGVINEVYIDTNNIISVGSSSLTADPTISMLGCGGFYPTKCKIDNVKIFNRALTDSEVTSLYNETISPIITLETESEVQDLYKETKRVKYKAITLDETNFGPASKFIIETQKEIKLLNYKTWTGTDAIKQGYRIYPVMNISDHTTEETTFNPKYYLGTKYQRNLSEILSQGIKSKRTIFNLKDMYLVDDLCIQTLKKINILLENDQMIKFTERLYQNGIREKINADLILEYLSTPVSGSSNNDIANILKISLIEDYNFTQEEIDNLNDNLNTFKSRARIALNAPVIQGSGLDQLRFNLPKTFIDNNRSQTEKKNLLVFGTDAGFDKFGLSGYTAPYSNISTRGTSSVLNMDDLTLGLPTLSSLEDISTIKDVQQSYGDSTQHILFENGNLYACRYVVPSETYAYNRDGRGFNKQSFPLKLINTNVKSMACLMYATFIIDNNNDVWALGGYSISGTSTPNLDYDIYGINSIGNYLPNWTKVFNSTPENTPKKIIGITSTTWLLMESGELFCTGYIPKYYTFDGINKYTKTWTSIATGVADINCGGYHVVYTMQNGDVYVGNSSNEDGLTTQGNNSTTGNTKALKIITSWIPTGQNITQIECTEENIYYLLSNGDVYGVGGNRGGQLQATPSSSTRISTPKKLYSNVKRIIPQLFGRNDIVSVLMVELNTGEIMANGNSSEYKLGRLADGNIGVTTPISLYPKVDKIFLTERTTIAIINGVMYLAGYNRVFGENTTNKTFLETKPLIALSDGFKDILTNYKQQIPFTYIPLSTDIKDINDKPVFETLTDITGFYKSEIIIDIPNVL